LCLRNTSIPLLRRIEDAFSRLEVYNEAKNAEMKAKQKTEELSATVN
jgi:hypothetical protein